MTLVCVPTMTIGAQTDKTDTTTVVQIGYTKSDPNTVAGAIDKVTEKRMNKTVIDEHGNTVTDRTGQPLVYKPWEVKLDLSGSPYVETAGARMRKYSVDKYTQSEPCAEQRLLSTTKKR